MPGGCLHITDHYRSYPYVLIRLPIADWRQPEGHVAELWRTYAFAKLRAQRPPGKR